MCGHRNSGAIVALASIFATTVLFLYTTLPGITL